MKQLGFFSKKEVESTTRLDGKALTCTACGLHHNCKSPRMLPFGNFRKKIMCIGEAPGDQEDQYNKPFQGKAGKLLQRTLKGMKIDLFDDCLSLHAVNCKPSSKGTSNYEIDCCRRLVTAAIEKHKPKLIILFGNDAVYSIIGHRWKKDLGGITKWRGWRIPDQDFQCWITPVFHPSYVEHSDGTEVTTVWENDLKEALEVLDVPFPIVKEPEIEILTDLSLLDELEPTDIAIDFETTGLKPHAAGHKIISMAIADSADHAFAFLMPESRNERRPVLNILSERMFGKMAHNMKFEEAWATVRLRQPIENWLWDSMQAAHVLDNRPGVTGLKFQTYVHFGVIDYASEVGPYLQSKGDSANEINRIQELLQKPNGKNTLLHYNALDAVYEYRLAALQRENILPF